MDGCFARTDTWSATACRPLICHLFFGQLGPPGPRGAAPRPLPYDPSAGRCGEPLIFVSTDEAARFREDGTLPSVSNSSTLKKAVLRKVRHALGHLALPAQCS